MSENYFSTFVQYKKINQEVHKYWDCPILQINTLRLSVYQVQISFLIFIPPSSHHESAGESTVCYWFIQTKYDTHIRGGMGVCV